LKAELERQGAEADAAAAAAPDPDPGEPPFAPTEEPEEQILEPEVPGQQAAPWDEPQAELGPEDDGGVQ
jgi:hypothetical protein